jgi:hypothetical protein
LPTPGPGACERAKKPGIHSDFPKEQMDPEQFIELHARCWEALKHYVHQAERMCDLLGQCLPEPSSLQTLSEITDQRVRENNAHASYLELRGQLLRAVRAGYEPLN